MRRIGLLGGISWAATADYYRRINLDVKRRLGGHHSADMLIRSFDLHPLLERADDVAALEQVFEDAGRALDTAGAAVFGIASFTGHRYSGKLKRLPLAFVDLIDAVGTRLRAASPSRVALWATSFALRDATLLKRLADSAGVRFITPPEDLHSLLDRIVFTELADQTVSGPSMEALRDLLDRQTADGAQALLLATTDFSPVAPLLRTSLPVLDATEIHCAALVDAALAQHLVDSQ